MSAWQGLEPPISFRLRALSGVTRDLSSPEIMSRPELRNRTEDESGDYDWKFFDCVRCMLVHSFARFLIETQTRIVEDGR